MPNAYDFVIVGSGAGGGPLAANLALEGFSVVVIEAGGDEINDNYTVPAFHARATEDPTYSWEFFVKHYSDDNDPQRDPKFHRQGSYPGAPGIFYPRACGLGGCTTHHAMITVYPHESDWDNIARIVKDESWSAASMRKYFDRIERAQYRDASVLLKLLEPDELIEDLLGRFRGFLRGLTASEDGQGARGMRGAGWLSMNQADPSLLLRDVKGVLKIVLAAFRTAVDHRLWPMPGLDPNNPDVATGNKEGVNVIPISVHNGKRTGARERLLGAQKIVRDQAEQEMDAGRLDIKINTFAKKVLFANDDNTRAIGVECVKGRNLYAARHHDSVAGQPEGTVNYVAKKEVILCGGAFNTPQLLMLSGIGPEEHLKKNGIEDVRVNLPGVGANLQDRYEVGVIARAKKPFRLLEKATFRGRDTSTAPDPDPVYSEWREDGEGIYATNGAVLGIIMRSSKRDDQDPPDLYVFGVPGYFAGYEVGYTRRIPGTKDHFTWAVLKGHTDNTAGCVRLRSKDPFATPEIHFKYFEEGDQPDENDVQSVVDGVEFVLEIYDRLIDDGVIEEVVAPASRGDLHKFVRDNAWGHHASCTCKIGDDDDKNAVLDKDFRVRGTKNLRVVDASVFPRIPGLFILSSVYMISEKASEVIIAKYS